MVPANYKVLLVDDDPAMLRLLTRWLEKAGYPVCTATDGHEALEAIDADCPDFLLTDWEMPRMDGLELCRQMRNMMLPHYVYTIFLTVRTSGADMIAGLEGGADDFLTKPVTEGELLARLQSSSRVLELERRLSLLAHTDFLTGLLTKRTFFDSLEKEWHRSSRFHLPLSCVMVDLDYFKQINDVYGHPAGDSVLKFVAEMLIDNSRASDTVCRYGGEEFCILMPETDESNAALWAERTRERLMALRIPTGEETLRITGSFGIAQCSDDSVDPEDLIKQADKALLCAKRSGRDRVVRHTALAEAAAADVLSADHHDEVFEKMAARDAMSPLSVCPLEHDTIDEVARFLLYSGASSTPVLDADGQLTGFVSEKDIMAVMTTPNCWHQPVSTVMRRNVISYEEDTPIRVIYEFLCRVTIRGIVITKNGRPTGTINRNSLLGWFHGWVVGKDPEAEVFLPHTVIGYSTRGMASV
jgi:two-component system, cell cycle response regulator